MSYQKELALLKSQRDQCEEAYKNFADIVDGQLGPGASLAIMCMVTNWDSMKRLDEEIMKQEAL